MLALANDTLNVLRAVILLTLDEGIHSWDSFPVQGHFATFQNSQAKMKLLRLMGSAGCGFPMLYYLGFGFIRADLQLPQTERPALNFADRREGVHGAVHENGEWQDFASACAVKSTPAFVQALVKSQGQHRSSSCCMRSQNMALPLFNPSREAP